MKINSKRAKTTGKPVDKAVSIAARSAYKAEKRTTASAAGIYMKRNPKLSVCLPSYNGEQTIGKALKSILQQSYQNFEIVVNDDCSKDQTEKVVKSFKDSRIKFFKNKKNLGYGDNLD